MFAFAIWDERRQTLFLARDHLGVKPLYYYWDGSLFAFGSELKSILQHPAVSRTPDLASIGLYLECQYIPAPRSIYRRREEARGRAFAGARERRARAQALLGAGLLGEAGGRR